MRFSNKLLCCLLSSMFLMSMSVDVSAKRLGGGRSFGSQSSSIAQKPFAPVTPNPSAAPRPTQATTPPPTANSPQPSRFGGMGGILGGIAAGVGLSMLLSHFGLGEAAASFMSTLFIIAALSMVGIWLMRKFMGGRNNNLGFNTGNSSQQSNYYSGQARQEPLMMNTTITPAVNPAIHQEMAPIQLNGPENFDQESFLTSAKKYFAKLQDASDRNDLTHLKEFTSAEMFELLSEDLNRNYVPNTRTEIVSLDADLGALEIVNDQHMASVRFSGMLREKSDWPAESFSEVWNWTKPTNGNGGWVLAGIQQIS